MRGRGTGRNGHLKIGVIMWYSSRGCRVEERAKKAENES
jgi:hypothetical protein